MKLPLNTLNNISNMISSLVNKKDNNILSQYDYFYYLNGSDYCKICTESGIIETTSYEKNYNINTNDGILINFKKNHNSYFNEIFKRYKDCTPNEYRQTKL